MQENENPYTPSTVPSDEYSLEDKKPQPIIHLQGTVTSADEVGIRRTVLLRFCFRKLIGLLMLLFGFYLIQQAFQGTESTGKSRLIVEMLVSFFIIQISLFCVSFFRLWYQLARLAQPKIDIPFELEQINTGWRISNSYSEIIGSWIVLEAFYFYRSQLVLLGSISHRTGYLMRDFSIRTSMTKRQILNQLRGLQISQLPTLNRKEVRPPEEVYSLDLGELEKECSIVMSVDKSIPQIRTFWRLSVMLVLLTALNGPMLLYFAARALIEDFDADSIVLGSIFAVCGVALLRRIYSSMRYFLNDIFSKEAATQEMVLQFASKGFSFRTSFIESRNLWDSFESYRLVNEDIWFDSKYFDPELAMFSRRHYDESTWSIILDSVQKHLPKSDHREES